MASASSSSSSASELDQDPKTMEATTTTTSATSQRLTPFEFFERVLRSPRYIVAPMVDASELPWRMLCRKYGAQLCYTPMYHSRQFGRSASYRQRYFTTCPEDRPLVVQFCSNNPEDLLLAAKQVEHSCDAVDINLGCPQHIAHRGHYGAFLTTTDEDWMLVRSMVETLRQNLSIPVFCKMRVFDCVERTVKFARMLQDAGCQMLAVHGRTKEQKGRNTGLADWSKIRAVKEALTIPVIANGNIQQFQDVAACLEATGADGVMSAEGILANPSLFHGPEAQDKCTLALEYLELAKRYPTSKNVLRLHLFWLFREELNQHRDLQRLLVHTHTPDDMSGMVLKLQHRLAHPDEVVLRSSGSSAAADDDNEHEEEEEEEEDEEALRLEFEMLSEQLEHEKSKDKRKRRIEPEALLRYRELRKRFVDDAKDTGLESCFQGFLLLE